MSEEMRAKLLVDRMVEALASDKHVSDLVTGYDVTEPFVSASIDSGVVTLVTDGSTTLYLAAEIVVGVAISAPGS